MNLLRAPLVALLLLITATAQADTLHIYSFRQPFLIEPILAEFSKQSGIETRVVFAQEGLLQRLQREGHLSPADVVLTSDFFNLLELAELGLTQPFKATPALTGAVPAHLRDEANQWLALTIRARSIYVAKDRQPAISTIRYEDLAKPEYRGRICTRSGKHPYNLSLVASLIVHHGEAWTEQWLRDVKANLARKPQGNDRNQIAAIHQGLCDVALGNSYYLGKMLDDPAMREAAESVRILFPNSDDRGTHVNLSGAAITRHAPNVAQAQQLLEFLTSPTAQSLYAELNMEYPVNPQVKPSALLQSWGSFNADPHPLGNIARHHRDALRLMDKVRFDL
ncbi:extracellular solute-binding protein [Venatoribacter cucullus]|uniref:Extracellular solute-binding protein n=1 Tax=Venatoribacter cucullus TaxID=2661630 RepID=A0A9X7UV87_9GAMM|nr:extracellular solute-binding protein [Venatoribacter cucullus]QQD24302.1 extracellular solute-binding protein [Venatoribacter cucullus]